MDHKSSRSLITKAFQKCCSFCNLQTSAVSSSPKSNSFPLNRRSISANRRISTPSGCLTVHVGPDKEKFVIRMECVNHPLFKMLLDEAELVYGFCSPGPLQLPCNVQDFYKVLSEIDEEKVVAVSPRCSFSKGYQPLSPSRLVIANKF